ncbi:MAG: hypothetical protein SF187_02475 [Deltaproteobacteria bacterium]|nr:hypothetical protein [Deltaproteobacteria bacterium]
MKANLTMKVAPFLRLLAMAAGVTGGAFLPGCTEDTEFAYFNVKVDIDPNSVDDDLRRKIASCGLFVTGDDNDQQTLPCTLNGVPYSLGVVDFSTSASRGKLVFTVKMLDLNREPIAVGSSSPVAIVPNTTTQTAVVAVSVVPKEDGGVKPGADASTGDANTAVDAGADAGL